MTASNLKETLALAGIHFDQVSKTKTGTYACRQAFFYRFGNSAEKLAIKIKEKFPQMEVVNTEEVWKPFRGGASIKAGSHFLVEVKLRE